MKKMERINDHKFKTLTAEESALVGGNAASKCTLTVSCTVTSSGDTLTVTDTITF
jgi:hypothetical protein